MYRRWLLLLAAVFMLGMGWTLYFDNKFRNASSVSNECREYLDTLDNTWVKATDAYFQRTCDYDNEFSRVRSEQQYRQYMDEMANVGMKAMGLILLAALLSFVGRWLFTGRLM
jgi:Tfp pilus assembly protein PilO